MCERPRPSFSDAIANLRREPDQRSMALRMLEIFWDRLRNRQTCCGNYGDPGC